MIFYKLSYEFLQTLKFTSVIYFAFNSIKNTKYSHTLVSCVGYVNVSLYESVCLVWSETCLELFKAW